MSVARAQREISSPEFSEWMAYAQLEPFGPEREDYRAGVVAALTANINRDPKKRSEPFEPEDFFPRYEDHVAAIEALGDEVTTTPPPAGNMESKLMAWAAAMQDNGSKQRPKSELRPKGER